MNIWKIQHLECCDTLDITLPIIFS